jgi:hypothetical protein
LQFGECFVETKSGFTESIHWGCRIAASYHLLFSGQG